MQSSTTKAFSKTVAEQCKCEKVCIPCFEVHPTDPHWGRLFSEDGFVTLTKSDHCNFLKNGMENPLNKDYVSLDASRPWIAYWITHALYLLDALPGAALAARVVDTLASMQHPEGGFCGGPGQLAHCAPTYASVLALASLAERTGNRSLEIIDRKALYSFFLRMKHPSGGYMMHHDGEVDSRGTYTVLAVAKLCNMLTDELVAGVSDFIMSTQSYEGGFGGEMSNEAHGGYNYCAISALLILHEYGSLNLDDLEHWLAMRQMAAEGGFSGRTNKLVDSCYSFWQGAGLAIVKVMRNGGHAFSDLEEWERRRDKRFAIHTEELGSEEIEESETVLDAEIHEGCLMFNQAKLMKYLMYCCQSLGGGMRDKPGKSRDFYHSCYALSGLSIAQHSYLFSNRSIFSEAIDISTVEVVEGSESRPLTRSYIEEDTDDLALVYGDMCNLINPTSLAFNIGLSSLRATVDYFACKPCVHAEILTNVE